MAAENPFRQPTDEEVFFMRDQERLDKEKSKATQQYKKVHEKMTASARVGSATTAAERADRSYKKQHAYLPEIAAPVSETQKDKENMADFIAKKREMGLIRMSLATKRSEIHKLEIEAERAEKRVKQQEEQLEETSQKFDHFLKDNDMKAVEAMKKAEAESKGKNEKTGEIKKLTAHNASVLAEKAKYDEQLNACMRYKHDLDKLTPDSWFRDTLSAIRIEDERYRLRAAILAEFDEASQNEDDEIRTEDLEEKVEAQLKEFTAKVAAQIVELPMSADDAKHPNVGALDTVRGQLDSMDPDKVPMFFTEPEKILDIFMEIEENNLFLIQNCQETEQALEELRTKYEEAKQKMDKQVAQLKSQIEIEKQKIGVEEIKKKALLARQQQSKDAKGQEELLKQIELKVSSIYKQWLGEDHQSQTTLGIMTQIETKLEELKNYIDDNVPGGRKVPGDLVSVLMKQQDKQRRDRLRQKKRNEDREKQQRRADQVLARAFQSVKKRVGKPVMWRSKPDEKKKEMTGPQEQTEDDDEEFFR
ncbi:hypothetical protein DIPPA_12001 [Diplonema papillatum]|nr:hypothetical protein DIPPA_12001 [Diplonema papillatum]